MPAETEEDQSGAAASEAAEPGAPATPVRRRHPFSLVRELVTERRRFVISFAIGLLVLLLIQIPAVEQSFLGGPDREMMETAFKLRSDVIAGTAEPVLFMDFDDRTIGKLAGAAYASPPSTTPRDVVAELLNFIRTAPPALAPRVVVLDVDIGTTSDGPAQKSLEDALAQWAASGSAPPLIIARQSYPGPTLGLPTQGLALPTTPYDAVVQQAPNIYWSTVKVLGDQNGEIREFLPFECVQTPSGVVPLYSAALLAYQFAERDQKALAGAAAKHWMADAQARCRGATASPSLMRGERIDFHFSLDMGFAGRVWPNLSPRWPGFQQCHDSDSAIFRRISVIDIHDALQAGGDVSRSLLCQHVVIIGGTNAGQGDFVQTPMNEMNGSVVLANAIRGLQLTHGGMRAIPLPFQVLMLLVISLIISTAAVVTERMRRHYRHLRRSRHQHKLPQRVAVVLLNPIIVNGTIAGMAHLTGILLLTVALNFGLWGFLSAPVFASAITETVQEFFDV